MARLQPTSDPYRVLGVLRGASVPQIKAAHRYLAKRFHPDGESADESRFLAVQEAYQLLTDPIRRAEWDRKHAPGPVRAGGSARRRTTSMRRARGTTRRARSNEAPGSTRPGARTARPQPEPGRRTYTWSAEHVPWWEDFTPRDGTGKQRGPQKQEAPADGSASTADGAARKTMDFDVFNRSSGAAWSMAARQHFRQENADLPSRGAWRYRGTQVVTGGEARKLAEEEAAAEAARRRSRRRGTPDKE